MALVGLAIGCDKGDKNQRSNASPKDSPASGTVFEGTDPRNDGEGTGSEGSNSSGGMGSDSGAATDPAQMGMTDATPASGVQLTVEDDIRYFSNTLYPVLVQNCRNCHAQMISPFFAVSDVAAARQTVVDTGKVNFGYPEGSRFVLRLREDRHNCWGDCEANATEMTQAISEWIRLRGDQSGSYFETSQSFKISDAVARVAQTERGTIVLEAEDGEANFRMTVEQDPTASNVRRAVALRPPDHPRGTIRTGRSEGSCGDQPYRIKEPARYPNQEDSPLKYALKIDATLQRPDGTAVVDSQGNPRVFTSVYMLPNGATDPDRDASGNPHPNNFYDFPRYTMPPSNQVYDRVSSAWREHLVDKMKDWISENNVSGFGDLSQITTSNARGYINFQFSRYHEESFRLGDQTYLGQVEIDAQRLYISPTGDQYKIYTDDQRGPGIVKFQVNIRTEGNYALWIRTQAQGFVDWNAHLKDSSGRVLPTYLDYAPDRADADCLRFTTRSGAWQWQVKTKGYQDESYQHKWRLSPGIYKIEVFERWPEARLDMIALSRMDEFNPKDVPFDASFVSDYRPRELSYDISEAVGEPAQFTIEVKEGSENSYILSNPRIISSRNVRVQFIQPVLNGVTHDNDAAFSIIDKVTGTEGHILRRQSMVILKDKGIGEDLLSFRFGILRPTDEEPTRRDDDAPAPVETRQCLAPEMFNRKVKPIFKVFQMVRQEDYNNFMERFPGNGNDIAASPNLYSCTGCHKNDHPLFPMSSFDDTVLCQQGLSRADFVNPERSVLVRGINGSYGHPQLYPLQDPVPTNDGYEVLMYQNQPLLNGNEPAYRSTWKGRFTKYAAGDAVMSETGRSEDEIRAIRKNIGAYKRIQFQYTQNDQGVTIPVKNGNNFVYSVLPPYDPGFGDGRLERAATGDETFDATRANWRNAVINWIQEEKRLFDEQMGQ